MLSCPLLTSSSASSTSCLVCSLSWITWAAASANPWVFAFLALFFSSVFLIKVCSMCSIALFYSLIRFSVLSYCFKANYWMKPMLSLTLGSMFSGPREGFSIFSEELASDAGTMSAVFGSITILPYSAGQGLSLPHGCSAGHGLSAPHGFSAGHGPPDPHGFSAGHGWSALQGASEACFPPTIILS